MVLLPHITWNGPRNIWWFSHWNLHLYWISHRFSHLHWMSHLFTHHLMIFPSISMVIADQFPYVSLAITAVPRVGPQGSIRVASLLRPQEQSSSSDHVHFVCNYVSYIYIHIYIYMYQYIYIFIYIYICRLCNIWFIVCTCMYIYICVCVCLHMCIYGGNGNVLDCCI